MRRVWDMLRFSAFRSVIGFRRNGEGNTRALFSKRSCSSGSVGAVVPSEPLPKAPRCSEAISLDQSTVELLERLSLVDFSNAEAVTRLEEAVKFASVIMNVDTTGVAPMVTPLEDVPLRLRPDIPSECCVDDILKNAKKTEEGYFVSPPGNIPLDIKSDYGLGMNSEASSEK